MCKFQWIGTALLLLVTSTGLFAQSQMQKAIAEIDKENYKEARAILSAIALTEPTNPEVFYRMGMAYIGDEDYVKAKEQFTKGIKVKTKYALNHVGLADVLLHEKKEPEAQIEFEKAQEHNAKTNDVNVWIAIGYAYLQNGRKYGTQAEKAFTYAKSIAPTNPKPVIALGDMYMRSGILPSAVTNYEEATKIDPKYAEGFYKLGLLRLQEGATLLRKGKKDEGIAVYLKALELLNKATDTDPNFAPAYREKGDGYYNAGNYAKARDEYKKYLALANNDLKARTRYVNFLYLSGNCAEALPEIEACLKDTTTNVLLRLGGYCNIETGNYAKAKDYMDKYFARVKPENTIAEDFDALGKMYLKQNNIELALENYNKCVDKDSSRYNVYNAFVDSATNRKNRAAAAKSDEEKKKFAEGDSIAAKKSKAIVAKYDEERKKYATEEAKYRKMFIDRKAKVEKDKSATDYIRLGQAYYYAGDLDNCEKVMKEITVFSPSYLSAYYWLGIVGNKREAAGIKDAAKPHYEKLIELLENKQNRAQYENDYLVSAYSYMAYNVGSKENSFDCELAKPYITKGLAIDPKEGNLNNLLKSCP